MRHAAEELGQRNTKVEAAPFDAAEMSQVALRGAQEGWLKLARRSIRGSQLTIGY
jgi:hypothetical protein